MNMEVINNKVDIFRKYKLVFKLTFFVELSLRHNDFLLSIFHVKIVQKNLKNKRLHTLHPPKVVNVFNRLVVWKKDNASHDRYDF